MPGIRVEEGLARLAAPLRATTSIENRQLAGALDPAPDPNYVWYRATLAQGWKRQLRRMFGAVEAPILRLVRVRIGTVRLGDLRSGRSRNLKTPEIKGLAALGNSALNRPPPGDARGSIARRKPGPAPVAGDHPTGIEGPRQRCDPDRPRSSRPAGQTGSPTSQGPAAGASETRRQVFGRPRRPRLEPRQGAGRDRS